VATVLHIKGERKGRGKHPVRRNAVWVEGEKGVMSSGMFDWEEREVNGLILGKRGEDPLHSRKRNWNEKENNFIE